MSEGRILVASNNGHYLLRLLGEVRVTMCVSLKQHIDGIFESDSFRSVTVDLREAKTLDSTTLGLLTRLALLLKKQYKVRPQAIYKSADIYQLLLSMGMDTVFDITDSETQCLSNLMQQCAQLDQCSTDDDEAVRTQVINAHKTLMSLNNENKKTFMDLVRVLESQS